MFDCKLALLASFKVNVPLKFIFESDVKGVNLQGNKRILNWHPFWNKVYIQCSVSCQFSGSDIVGQIGGP